MAKKKENKLQELAITAEELKKANELLREYKEGKTSIDQKATDNQEWWRLRHWPQMQRQQSANNEERPASAWLFNSVINKHADIMDNYPKLNILPREADDVMEADMLSKIIPVIHERNDEEEVYSQAAYDLIIDGGAITGVFWDSSANNGLGEIVKRNVDVHNLFWQPGVTDIQDSRHIFNVMLEDVDVIRARYPEHAERIAPGEEGLVTSYLHDDNIDTSEKCEVVDWYYKTTVMVPTVLDDDGNVLMSAPRQMVHYVKYVNDTVLFASENMEEYRDTGYYDHGKYPFVVRRLFAIKDTPWGFGFVDVMKSPQKYIDALDQIIMKNSMMKGKPRWFVRKNAGIDLEKFADWDVTFVEVSGSGDLGASMMQMEVDSLPAAVMTHLMNKIEELKETSGNRDFSQGSTASGVTAASAIAALQEAGGKLARDVNKVMYRGSRQEGELEVELIRQFYTEPRSFRIEDGDGNYRFETYPADGINDERKRGSVFDVKISAEKQSPFSRAAQNETAKEMYSMGMFNPQMAEPALACIDMMEFEGKEQVKDNIQKNSLLVRQVMMMQQSIMQLDAMFPGLGIAAAAGIGLMQQGPPVPNGEGKPDNGGTAEERAARKDTDTTKTAKARTKAARQAEV